MNKDLLDQVPAEEQSMASKISSIVENMQPPQAFQWELENQLLNKAASRPAQNWFAKIIVPVGWAVAAFIGVLLLNSLFRSFVPPPSPAAGSTPTEAVSFVDSVRAGNICMGPLALAHGFTVFLTNPEKTEFAVVNPGDTSTELRSFTWSADGKQLAIITNSMGSGNIYLTDSSGVLPQPVIPPGEVGYLMDAAWSRDGKQLIMWSSQNNTVIYLMNADGSGLTEIRLGMQLLSTPQFTQDNQSIILFGANANAFGLFEVTLENLEFRLISPQVEDETGFIFSPDGSRLAYMEMDRNTGEARLISEEMASGSKMILGTLPIPKGSGSSLPESANLNWSTDGELLVFDIGRYASDRAIYLAQADGTGMIKVVDAGYAPTISADGKCLAYISENEVFLTDLNNISVSSIANRTILVGELPTGRGTPNFKQDKLQWSPGTTP